ncbi:Cytochrome c family protein [Candidatus Promineifilum breve]|uniref:Cytochrome c family protein n=1 Tax=Candidatus Promineifilum breve TaxID=1806508 RepID=A0A160SXF8_9CHLR|nr:cytochrome c [Candidatus Promineifilum breve]CUS01981.2 Cytochrome c family protein [Candidatus Promineifilum breve]
MMRKYTILALLALLVVLALAACGGGGGGGESSEPVAEVPQATATSAGDAAAGKTQFDTVCIACHGPGGVGVEGLGKPFTTSEFLLSVNDQELLEFVKTGRPVGHPDNTTGVDMPPKGGNPALTDAQLMDIIAYIRTLHE